MLLKILNSIVIEVTDSVLIIDGMSRKYMYTTILIIDVTTILLRDSTKKEIPKGLHNLNNK